MKKKVICIVGPTASGKTGLSVELAKNINGQIISADSMQLYKDLDIATAKVTEEEMKGVKHHLIDICPPDKNFSVADFKKMCYDKIDEIISVGSIPIIVGGTGLYINAVVDNMQFENQEINFDYRRELENIAKNDGKEELYEMLRKLDPSSAEAIHPNNVKRVIRALEIAKFSTKLKSEHMHFEEDRKKNSDTEYDFLVFYIDYDRKKLYDRINKRVDIMIKDGLVNEAKKVYDMNLPTNYTCMQAIGYKEIFPFFRGEKTLEECIENLKVATRKYAKRQETWFKNKLDIIYIDGESSLSKKLDLINSYLSF